MNWIFLSLLTALAAASQDAWVKRYFSSASTSEMLAFPLMYSIPLFGAMLLLLPIPRLDEIFLWSFTAGIPLNALGLLLHMRAIQVSPLSLTLPYLSFTPVFMFFTGFMLLGESPNLWGALGVCIIVAGSYVLNINPAAYTPLLPLKAAAREKGARLMLLTAFIYSITAVLGKIAIMHSSVMFFTVSFFAVLDVVTLLAMVLVYKLPLSRLAAKPIHGVVAGALLFAHAVCHGWAISLSKAVYMIALKRMSIVFGIIYGGLLFHEHHLFFRLLGAGLMIIGAALISLKGM